MAKRTNHYDAAFEAYLRRACVPFIVVDEARRARLNQVSLKSMDFIVTAPGNQNLLVDVKGRQFPSGRGPLRSQTGHPRNGHKWENWATKDDLDSLLRWQEVFGDGFRSMLVFAYELLDPRVADDPAAGLRVGPEGPFWHRGRVYAFFGVWADEYRTAMHSRSQSWETVSVPSRQYRDLRIPFAELLGC
ncbi:MAG TPA: HYExAFE family protein [Planctomycetaceae bacterium]|nr:HYExAFE family protein [Planctomycetaceae bacterium]